MNNPPSFLRAFRRQDLPSAPPPVAEDQLETALSNYRTLRDNYVKALAQVEEQAATIQQLGAQNGALERTISDDRAFYMEERERERGEYRTEIRRLTIERDMLSAYVQQMNGNLETISQVILNTMRAATAAASQVRQAERDQDNHEVDQQETESLRKVHDAIVSANPRPEDRAGTAAALPMPEFLTERH